MHIDSNSLSVAENFLQGWQNQPGLSLTNILQLHITDRYTLIERSAEYLESLYYLIEQPPLIAHSFSDAFIIVYIVVH